MYHTSHNNKLYSTMSTCPNCQTPLQGNYCHHCGQSTRGTDRFLLTLINEAFEDIFSLNSRVWKTFSNLLFRPGFLSTEYYAGRRVRYIPPVRLYFTLSILFFLVYSIFNFFSSEQSVDLVQIGKKQQEQSTQTTPDPTSEAEAQNTEDISTPADALNAEQEQQEEEDWQLDLGPDDSFDVPGLTPEEEAALRAKLQGKFKKAIEQYQEDPEILSDYVREVAPPIIFILLPLFAILLKLFYVFKGMYYTQHLVLAVHNHCFIFLWLTLTTIFDHAARSISDALLGLVELGMYLWLPIYLWLSLRKVYQQSRFVTTIKFVLLALCYSVLAGIAAVFTVLFGIFTL